MVAGYDLFVANVPFYGFAVLCIDLPAVLQLIPRLSDHRFVTYGFSPQADLVAQDVVSQGGSNRFTVRHVQHGVLGEVTLPLPGRHNVQNALAAIGVSLAVGLDFATIARGLAAFRGVHRRFERLGGFGGATVVDDYAHHPAEVAATLAAARDAFSGARLHAVFQPHLYSRTQQLATDFGRALLLADVAWVTDVYAAREQPIAGVTGELIVDAARGSGHRNVRYVTHWRELPPLLGESVGAGDVVLTMGAGDVFKLGQQLVAGGGQERSEPSGGPA
jgi:UDP-N-acetylmuramate--alanine ligase